MSQLYQLHQLHRHVRHIRGCNSFTTAIKRHFSLAFNQSTTKNASANTVTPGLNSVKPPKALFKEPAQRPNFQVVNAGPGAILNVKLRSNGGHVYTAPGAVIGMSSKAKLSILLNGGPFQAPLRKIGGAPFLWQKVFVPSNSTRSPKEPVEDGPSSNTSQEDVFLAPRYLSDIALLPIAPNTMYTVRPSAVLALSEGILMGTSWRPPNDAGMCKYELEGDGIVALSAFGGIFRLVLEKDEEFVVDSRTLIAYSTIMRPTPIEHTPIDNTIPSRLWAFTKRQLSFLIGRQQLVKLTGPGDFYITSRVPITLSLSRGKRLVTSDSTSTQLNVTSQEIMDSIKTGAGRAYEKVKLTTQDFFVQKKQPLGTTEDVLSERPVGDAVKNIDQRRSV